MKENKIIGILTIILGLIIAFTPFHIFKVCGTMPDMIMKCHWTGRAVVPLGIAVTVFGILILLSKEKAYASALSFASAINGVLIILLPTVVIGVCGSSEMNCKAATLPALVIEGAFIILLGVINTLFYLKSRKAA